LLSYYFNYAGMQLQITLLFSFTQVPIKDKKKSISACRLSRKILDTRLRYSLQNLSLFHSYIQGVLPWLI